MTTQPNPLSSRMLCVIARTTAWQPTIPPGGVDLPAWVTETNPRQWLWLFTRAGLLRTYAAEWARVCHIHAQKRVHVPLTCSGETDPRQAEPGRQSDSHVVPRRVIPLRNQALSLDPLRKPIYSSPRGHPWTQLGAATACLMFGNCDQRDAGTRRASRLFLDGERAARSVGPSLAGRSRSAWEEHRNCGDPPPGLSRLVKMPVWTSHGALAAAGCPRKVVEVASSSVLSDQHPLRWLRLQGARPFLNAHLD